jgi:Flp pilus assembly protein TadG
MRNRAAQHKNNSKKLSRGAAAIEFVFLFMIFFTFFYATVTYSLIFLLQTSFHHAANEGARSAISIDPQAFANDTAYFDTGVAPLVRSTVGAALSWLPTTARDQVLGTNNGNVEVTRANNVLTVRVIYRNYATNPLIPLITIPGIGPIFSGPADLQGRAVLRLV